MTMRNRFGAALAAMLSLSAAAVATAAAGEEKIAFDKLPAAVKKAVKKDFHGAKVRGAVKEVEDGKTSYEVELTVAGHSIDVVVNPHGRVLEIEKEIPVDHLPGAVRKTLAAKYPGARIEKAERVARGKHGPTLYEVDIKTEVLLTQEGKIVRAHDEEEEHERHEHGQAAHGERKKEHHDAHDDDDDDDEHEHHRGSAHGEKHERHEHGEAAHGERKKEHHDAHDDDDDDDEHEHHRGSAHGEKPEHREHAAAHDGKKQKKEHEDPDDDDDDKDEDEDND